MVRNIVGTLIECGRGNLDAEGVRGLLVPFPAKKAGPTAPAPPQGLFLISVGVLTRPARKQWLDPITAFAGRPPSP